MLKSQLEPTSTTARNYEPATTMFVENIFDTVKKAKAAKAAAAKSLADSKLISSYQYSFADMSPLKKKKKRKNTKANGKIKKPATPKKKASPRKHKIVNKKVGEQQKKSTPPKSPRKYTKRAAKIPVANDIDDEEAAFILSSISQRSFDSFYSRLNSCGSTNKITIPLEVSNSVKSFSSSSDPVRNLAYYVMLDHNYWIVEPEVPAEPEVPVVPEIELAPEVPVVQEIPFELIPEPAPIEIPVQLKPEEKQCKVEETTPIDIKPIFDCNTICQSNEIYKAEEVEENNNKLVSPEKDISQIVACQKKDTTAVKKRWLRRAATEMKTPPKKKKKLDIEEIKKDIERHEVDVEDGRGKTDVGISEDSKEEQKIEFPEAIDLKTLTFKDIKVETIESPAEVVEPKTIETLATKAVELVAESKSTLEEPEAESVLVFKAEDKLNGKLEKKCEEILEKKAENLLTENIETEEKLCNESPKDEIQSSLKEAKVEFKLEHPKEQTNITKPLEENIEDEEIDEKSWDSVMDFHRLQLKKLANANLRHTRTVDITAHDHSTSDRSYSFQKARSLSVTPKSCDNEFVNKAEANYSRLPSFPGCTMLNLAQHADSSRTSHEYDKHEPFFHKSSPFAPQRSLSKTFLNNHCRASRFENSLSIPYNASSYETPFYGEPYHQKDEISSRTSYSTYRQQKALQVTHIQTPEHVDPAWEKQFGRPLDEFTTQRSLIMKKCDETPLVGGISRILSKPTLSVTTLPKARTSVSDPRLNPSLVNDTRKDEAAIPKKKVRI